MSLCFLRSCSLGMYVLTPPRGRFGRSLPFWWGHPATGLARPGGVATPPVCELRISNLSVNSSIISGCVAHCKLTAQACRLSNYILQRSFFFFARMSCSEQSAFHGQASDRAWFFSELLFQNSKRRGKKKELSEPARLAGLVPSPRGPRPAAGAASRAPAAPARQV